LYLPRSPRKRRRDERTVSSPSGSLEHWLTERYCLYTFDRQRRILRRHPPSAPATAPADAEIDLNTMTAEIALDLRGEPLLHCARRQDVVFWTLQPGA
jgi:hypothetical protein